jgi:hypothetical protein
MNKIIILGSGETTRANVEALLDDYIYANKDLELAFIISGKPSDGQVWSAQFARERDSQNIKIYRTESDSMAGLPLDLDVVVTDTPVNEILSGSGVEAFFLWNDEDTTCLNYLSQLSSKGIVCKDFTNGLVEIKASTDIQEVVAPEIPKQEQLSIEDSYVEIDLESAEDAEEEYEDPLYEGIRIMAEIFAEAIAKELKKVLKK